MSRASAVKLCCIRRRYHTPAPPAPCASAIGHEHTHGPWSQPQRARRCCAGEAADPIQKAPCGVHQSCLDRGGCPGPLSAHDVDIQRDRLCVDFIEPQTADASGPPMRSPADTVGAGVAFRAVNSAYTSQMCNECGHTERMNRPTQDHFECRMRGHTDNADHNAVKNISAAGQAAAARRGDARQQRPAATPVPVAAPMKREPWVAEQSRLF